MRRISADTRDTLKGWAFISPWVIGFLAFALLPISMSLYYSLCDYSLFQPPIFRGLENYRRLMHDAVFWKALTNTAYYAVMALPLGLMMSLSAALMLNVKTRGQSVYRTIIFLPSLVPAVASAMLWLWLFNGQLGLINLVLRHLGIANPPEWLSDVNWAMPALVLMSLWGVGNTVVIYLAGLQDVPKELYEAAELDGASFARRLWHVTLPCISPVIFFNLVMAIIGTLQVFGAPYIMTGGGPARSTYFFTMYLYDNAFSYLKMGYASAMAWVQLVLVILLTAIAAWSSKHWVHQSAR
jgi:multiple sugar transport system permease protein